MGLPPGRPLNLPLIPKNLNGLDPLLLAIKYTMSDSSPPSKKAAANPTTTNVDDKAQTDKSMKTINANTRNPMRTLSLSHLGNQNEDNMVCSANQNKPHPLVAQEAEDQDP